MAEILVLSDSHGATSRLMDIAQIWKEGRFSAMVHLGDVIGDAQRLEDFTGHAVLSVSGNCDYFSPTPRELTAKLFSVDFYLTHGDRYGVKSGLSRLSYRAEELGCKVALFGHTHRAFAGYVGRTLLVNPGALKDGCYAKLTLQEDQILPRLLHIFQE